MHRCPICRTQLTRQSNDYGFYLACSTCGGLAVALPVLRKCLANRCVEAAWAAALRNPDDAGRPCPVCSRAMEKVPVSVTGNQVQVDLCRACHFMWFDAGELQELPALPPPAKPQRKYEHLPQAARELLAIEEVKRIARKAEQESADALCDWRVVPAVFGLPVEAEEQSLRRIPLFTWSLTLMIASFSFAAMQNLANAVGSFGMVPAELVDRFGITSLTSFFVHGGWLHLISNLYFLVVFGDNVEDHLGPGKTGLLVLLALLAGDVLHFCFEPRSNVPLVGASGGISGLIAFYCLRFPHLKLKFLFRYFYVRLTWISMPAWAAFLCWLGLQLYGAHQQLTGISSVSAFAHLGGAATGTLFWLWDTRVKADLEAV